MGNPLYLALRLVLGAQTPAVCTAQLEDSKALFSFVALGEGLWSSADLLILRSGVWLADSGRIRMAPGQSGLGWTLSFSMPV